MVMREPAIIVAAGGAYFSSVFLLGVALGVVRTLAVAPHSGEALAVAIELPLLLAASWGICGWLIRWLRVSGRWPDRLAMGAIAFLLLMAGELAVSLLMFDRTPAEHAMQYAEVPHQLGLAGQILFAFIPVLRPK